MIVSNVRSAAGRTGRGDTSLTRPISSASSSTKRSRRTQVYLSIWISNQTVRVKISLSKARLSCGACLRYLNLLAQAFGLLQNSEVNPEVPIEETDAKTAATLKINITESPPNA